MKHSEEPHYRLLICKSAKKAVVEPIPPNVRQLHTKEPQKQQFNERGAVQMR